MFSRPGNATPSKTDSKAERKRPDFKADLEQLKKLLSFVKPYWTPLVVSIIATAISSGLSLVFPQVVGNLVNGALTVGAGTSSLDQSALLLFGVFLVQAVFNFVRTLTSARAGEGTVADLRSSLFEHIMRLPLRFFESRRTGEITSRLTSDVTVVQGLVSQDLNQFITQLFILIGGVIILFVKNSLLTLVMLSVVPVVVLGGAFFGRGLRKLSTEFQDKLADANANAEESIVGIRVVQSFTAEKVEAGRYRKAMRAAFESAMRRARTRAWFVTILILATFSSLSLVLWFGGRQVVDNKLLVGDLIAFLIYTLVVAGAIGALTGLATRFSEAAGATQRIFELFQEENNLVQSSPRALPEVQGQVTLEHISFSYGDRGETNVLEDISFTARPGEVIALVGPSGGGKSTLVSLIPRFYDPLMGRILLDGQDIKTLDLEKLRENIGLVPQETQLFSGTVRDNIRYGRPEASDFEVEDAAKAANALEFISGFPAGLDTVVGERGLKLSGGQRQRIAIARALLKNPRILILDEATSALDNESEALVQEALELLMVGRTTFVIAHRLSTVRGADRILVLEAGKIVEQGTHEALIAQGGLYKDLYELQFRRDRPQRA
ncbi:MAG: ATP-binding cassette domain-containing protein [Pseudopedobacter sp.]|nr:ATP-binding cassette domain-containing protein [Deinococcales bacterium]